MATTTKKSAPKREENPLKELFVDELKDMLWAEKQLVKSLKKLSKSATSEELKNA
ncbi:MAG: Ferritin-like metal-binding protein YciE, partial [Mucilaginibacter sp.]|nr:Ferritin-like metal-binding protein YciE [Mucilaginibacter sp.]